MNKNKITIIVILLIALISIIVFSSQSGKTKSLQENEYKDDKAHFSIFLPEKWNVLDSSNATNTSSTLFSNGSSTIVVKRFERTDKVDQAIKFMGEDQFMVFMTDQLAIDIDGYKLISTTTEIIGQDKYFKALGSYTGKGSKKDVNQYSYIRIVPDAYYLIGVDIYNDVPEKDQYIIFKSIETLRLF